MDLTPKQQTSEAIRQAETILIITGQHPTVDQVASVMALAAILRKFGKKVSAIVSDNPPAAISALDMGGVDRGLGGLRDFVLKVDVTKAEVDKLRYEIQDGKLNIYLTPFKGGFAPNDVTFGYGAFHYDLAIVLGVPTRARIDRIYEQNQSSFETIPMVNLDFHRSNENYGAVNLIEPNASSLCEMLVALSESLQSGIVDADIATALLMGIVASTDRFTAAHTSPKSLTVAAQMMAAGAKQQMVVRALYRDGKAESRGDRSGGNSDRGDRSGGGSDRGSNERGERGERGGQRSQSQAGGQNASGGQNSSGSQSSAHQQEPRSAQQPQAPAPRSATEAPRPAAEARVEPRVERAPEREAAPAPAPVFERAPEPAPVAEPAREELPIIQPSHIEMSAATQPAQTAPAPVVAPVQPERPVVQAQPIVQSMPVQPEISTAAPDRPKAMPTADFAAAAEMFSNTTPADHNSEQE